MQQTSRQHLDKSFQPYTDVYFQEINTSIPAAPCFYLKLSHETLRRFRKSWRLAPCWRIKCFVPGLDPSQGNAKLDVRAMQSQVKAEELSHVQGTQLRQCCQGLQDLLRWRARLYSSPEVLFELRRMLRMKVQPVHTSRMFLRGVLHRIACFPRASCSVASAVYLKTVGTAPHSCRRSNSQSAVSLGWVGLRFL